MGTRFCVTKAPINEAFKQRMVENDERQTNLIFRTLHNTARVMKNAVSDEVVGIERKDRADPNINIWSLELGAGTRWPKGTRTAGFGRGHGAGPDQRIPTVKELIDGIMADAEKLINERLRGVVSKALTQRVVIGAGVVGLATALALQRPGVTVTLIDRLAPGSGTSSVNAGIVAAGSVHPESMPGLLASLPSMLLNPGGPLHLRPGFLLKQLPWLLRFLAQARPAGSRPLPWQSVPSPSPPSLLGWTASAR